MVLVLAVCGESLAALLDREGLLPLKSVKKIAKQVLLGLDCKSLHVIDRADNSITDLPDLVLHTECKLIHTDLKPANILTTLSPSTQNDNLDDTEQIIRGIVKPLETPPFSSSCGSENTVKQGKLPGVNRHLVPGRNCIVASAPLVSPKLLRRTTSSTLSEETSAGESSCTSSLILSSAPTTAPSSPVQITKCSTIPRPAAPFYLSTRQSTFKLAPALDIETRDVRAFSTYDSEDATESEMEVGVQIADLGNCPPIDCHVTDDVQTRQYRSPEVILGKDWNSQIDVWSVACIVRIYLLHHSLLWFMNPVCSCSNLLRAICFSLPLEALPTVRPKTISLKCRSCWGYFLNLIVKELLTRHATLAATVS